MRLADAGIAVDVPRGWEARIYRPAADPLAERGNKAAASQPPVLHAATFPLPEGRGDFGSGAVELMGADDVFLALIEFDEADVGTPLFSREGLPQQLEAVDFGPDRLQRAIPGQAGTQVFFTAGGRAFCLYVVLGSARARATLVRRLDDLLAGLQLAPAGGAS